VRLRELQKRNLKDLVWYVVGFLVVQAVLAVGVESWWPVVRDPDYERLKSIIQTRQAEFPGRQLEIVLGSSRTKLGLRAEQLNHPEDGAAPLVINCGVSAGGPMMDQVLLRRLLEDGIRPNRVFVEVMPMSLSIRHGAPSEEKNLPTGRFSALEVVRLFHYYAQPYRLLGPWGLARIVPVQRHHAELRDALELDVPAEGRPEHYGERDDFGWAGDNRSFSGTDVARQTQENLVWYESALTQPAPAPGALEAYRDLVTLCTREHIDVVLFVPPEGSAFRTFAPDVAACQMDTVRDLACELKVPLIDGRTWVDDDKFFDGHHTTIEGARQFTRGFKHAVIEAYSPTAEAGANASRAFH
jgi:hypothetical protein